MNSAFLVLTMFLLGADMKPPTPPVLPDSLLKNYYKAESELSEAAIQANQAAEAARQNIDSKRKVVSDAVDALNKACGNGFVAQKMGADDPKCVAIPPPAPAPPVPPAPKK
jgi:hypothetical protein